MTTSAFTAMPPATDMSAALDAADVADVAGRIEIDFFDAADVADAADAADASARTRTIVPGDLDVVLGRLPAVAAQASADDTAAELSAADPTVGEFDAAPDAALDAALDAAPALSEWKLVGCFDGGAMAEVEVDAQPFVIGRRDCCDLTVDSPRVSGRHAELMRVGDHLLLRDLGSTNGTFLQGEKIVDVAPIGDGDLIQVADVEMRLKWAAEQSAPVVLGNETTAVEFDAFEPSWMFTSFEKLLGRPGVIPYYQAVHSLADGRVEGLEVLARSNIQGLESPFGMFTTAELLGRECELSRECRHRGVFVARRMAELTGHSAPVFLNTHPAEDLLGEVLPDVELIRRRYPEVALVLEIHEAAFASVPEMRTFATELAGLGVELAYDDFGAGQSRLVELLEVPPQYLKFDRSIITAMTEPCGRQARMVEHLLGMMAESGIRTLAEGVETEQQADLCRQVGFELVQGFLYGRPQPAEPEGLDDTVEVPLSRTDEM